MTTGDKIKLNELFADIETVMTVTGCMVRTFEGNTYHQSKVVRA